MKLLKILLVVSSFLISSQVFGAALAAEKKLQKDDKEFATITEDWEKTNKKFVRLVNQRNDLHKMLKIYYQSGKQLDAKSIEQIKNTFKNYPDVKNRYNENPDSLSNQIDILNYKLQKIINSLVDYLNRKWNESKIEITKLQDLKSTCEAKLKHCLDYMEEKKIWVPMPPQNTPPAAPPYPAGSPPSL